MNQKQSAAVRKRRPVIMGRDGRHIYAARATASVVCWRFAAWWLRVMQWVWHLVAKPAFPEET
jgi:hypothetical protein